MSKIDIALVDKFCKKFAPCVASNWANNHLNIYIRLGGCKEPVLSCYGLGKVNWSNTCEQEDPFYKEFQNLLTAIPSGVDELQIKYFCGRVRGVELVKWEDDSKEEVSELSMSMLLTFEGIVSSVRSLLSSFGVSGIWRLYEEKGTIYLTGSNNGCKIHKGSLSTYGRLGYKDLNAISLSLRKTLVMLSSKVHFNVKEISFPVSSQNITSGTMVESKDEPGSFVVSLS